MATLTKDELHGLKASLVQGVDVGHYGRAAQAFYDDVYTKLNSDLPGPFEVEVPADPEFRRELADAIFSEVADEPDTDNCPVHGEGAEEDEDTDCTCGLGHGNDYGYGPDHLVSVLGLDGEEG